MRRAAWIVCLAAVAAALGGPTARAGERLRIVQEDVALEADPDVEIAPSLARGVLAEARKAFATLANTLGVNSVEVFAQDGRDPLWMPSEVRRDPRVIVELSRQAKPEDAGYDACLSRMEKGRLSVLLAPPEGEVGPEFRRRLWEGVAVAILAQSLWRGAPVWWREALPVCLAEAAMEESDPAAQAARDELTGLVDRLPVAEVLAAESRAAWSKASGRSVGWGLAHLLTRCDEAIAPSLFNQSRRLLRHLVYAPNGAAVTREYTDLVRMELSAAGATEGVLRGALADWIRGGFPEGPALRRSAAGKALSDLGKLKPFGFGLAARWGRRYADEVNGGFVRGFNGGTVTWRLPWRASLEAYAGVRDESGMARTLRPRVEQPGRCERVIAWSAPEAGTKDLPGVVLAMPRVADKHGFLLVAARSPAGLGYADIEEQALR